MAEKDSAPFDLGRIPMSIYAFFLGILGLSSFGVLGSREVAPVTVQAPVIPAASAAATGNPADSAKPGAGKVDTANQIPAPLRPLADSLGLTEIKSEEIGAVRLHFLIATIPDPDTVSYASYSNLAIESIMRAAQFNKFNFDRHWLPWVGNTPEDSLRNSRPRSDEPGVLLFRKDQERLVVFLVGESPTAGIHIPAYVKATSYVKRFRKTEPISNGEKDGPHSWQGLSVIGPTFSGSAESLRLASARLGYGKDSVRFVSGSATGSAVGKTLEPFPFEPMLVSDSTVQSRLKQFYDLRSLGDARIAVLGESGTEYSSQALDQKAADQKAAGQKTKDPWTFTFPMQISRVREAYQNDPLLRDFGTSSASSGKPAQVRTELELKLALGTGGYDKIPDWAKDLSAKSQELVLRRVVEQLEEKRPRLITLFASDIRDLLFVGGFIRLNANKARIVVFDNDVIYSSKGAAYSLETGLSAATHPLFDRTDSDVWFSSQMGQGFYEATDYCLRGEKGADADQRPVWLTVFSSGENWPVAVLPASEAIGRENMAGIKAIPDRLKKLGRQWIVANTLLWVLALLTLRYWTFSSKFLWREGTVEFRWLRSLLQGALLVLVASFAGVSYRLSSWEPGTGIFLAVAGGVVAALVLRDLVRQSVITMLLAGAIALVAAAIPWFGDWLEPNYQTGDFYAARSAQLANGVSPMLPIAIALLIIAGSAFSKIFAEQALRRAPDLGEEICKAFEIPALCHPAELRVRVLRQDLVAALIWSALAIPMGRLLLIDTLENLAYSGLMVLLICGVHLVVALLFAGLLRTALHLIAVFSGIEAYRDARKIHRIASTPGVKHWMRTSEDTLRQRQTAIRQLEEKIQADSDDDASKDADESELRSLKLGAYLETLVFAARRQGYYLAASLVAMAAMFQWYPFQPSTTLLNFAGVAYLAIGAVLMWLYLRLEQMKGRSPLYQPDTEGIQWLAVLRFASTFGVPFLAIGGSLIPQYGRTAFQWLLFLANSAK